MKTPSATAHSTISNGAVLIASERQRQIEKEGWSAAHDDGHSNQEMILAAIAYASVDLARKGFLRDRLGLSVWPWETSWWKPNRDHIRNLVKAGALIAAEIDRLERQREGS